MNGLLSIDSTMMNFVCEWSDEIGDAFRGRGPVIEGVQY